MLVNVILPVCSARVSSWRTAIVPVVPQSPSSYPPLPLPSSVWPHPQITHPFARAGSTILPYTAPIPTPCTCLVVWTSQGLCVRGEWSGYTRLKAQEVGVACGRSQGCGLKVLWSELLVESEWDLLPAISTLPL